MVARGILEQDEPWRVGNRGRNISTSSTTNSEPLNTLVRRPDEVLPGSAEGQPHNDSPECQHTATSPIPPAPEPSTVEAGGSNHGQAQQLLHKPAGLSSERLSELFLSPERTRRKSLQGPTPTVRGAVLLGLAQSAPI